MYRPLSFRAKLITVRIIYLLIIAVFALTAHFAITSLTALLKEQSESAVLLRNGLLMDMRHDNTRALIMTAFKDSEDPSSTQTKQAELTAEYQANKRKIDEYLANLEKSNLSENGRKALATVKPGFDAMLAAGDKIIAEVFQDRNKAQQSLPTFTEKFKALEINQESLFDAIEAQISTIETRAHTVSNAALQFIIIAFIIGTALIFIASMFVVRTITNRTETAHNYVNQMAEGNLDLDIRTEHRDEISKILLAVARLRTKLVNDVLKHKETSENLKSLIGQIQGSAVHVNSSINQMSASSREQESMVNEVAATITQVATSSKEIASTTKELLRTMHEAVTITETSGSLAASGQQDLAKMSDTMQGVMDASTSINARLAMLNEKAGNISQVTTTIAKVADQTNLLSLNAAIEAEKAGEHGRGFAIVATEIRRLADQTAVASYDINLIVKEMQSAVSASVMGMDKFSDETRRGLQDIQQISLQLSQVIDQVHTLIPKYTSINEGMTAQSDASEQISHGLTQVNDAMRQIVETVHHSTSAVQDIARISSGLSSAVALFETKH